MFRNFEVLLLFVTELIAGYFCYVVALSKLWCVQVKERESWETASQALKAKLEIAESNCIRAEVEVAKIRSTYYINPSTSFLIFISRWIFKF